MITHQQPPVPDHLRGVTPIAAADLPALGAPLGGGFFAARYWLDGYEYALIDLGADAEVVGEWGDLDDVFGASSQSDGWANTAAMASSACAIALQIAPTFPDAFIPSPLELQLLFVAKKAGILSGFVDTWYWSSKQYSANTAWFMGFSDGIQYVDGKNNERRVRPVRRLLIQPTTPSILSRLDAAGHADRITVVLKPMPDHLLADLQDVAKIGMPVAIGRAGGVITSVFEGDQMEPALALHDEFADAGFQGELDPEFLRELFADFDLIRRPTSPVHTAVALLEHAGDVIRKAGDTRTAASLHLASDELREAIGVSRPQTLGVDALLSRPGVVAAERGAELLLAVEKAARRVIEREALGGGVIDRAIIEKIAEGARP